MRVRVEWDHGRQTWRSELVLLARLRALPVRARRHAALFGRRAGAHALHPRDELLDVGPRGLGELDGLVRVRVRVRGRGRGWGRGRGMGGWLVEARIRARGRERVGIRSRARPRVRGWGQACSWG